MNQAYPSSSDPRPVPAANDVTGSPPRPVPVPNDVTGSPPRPVPVPNDVTAEQNTVAGTAREVAETAKEHAREVGGEVAEHTRRITGQIRERLTGEAENQNERLTSSLRQLSDELGTMRHQAKDDSLAATVVQRLSEGSRQVADYLEQHGPDGVLREVQDFARRKPGTFLLTAAAAGFVVGRLGKGVLAGTSASGNGSGNGSGQSTSGLYRSTNAGYRDGTAPSAAAMEPVPGDISPQLTNPGSVRGATGTPIGDGTRR